MNPNDPSDFTAANLIALRDSPDALKIITERLNVKQMGPADHIRTKHEVKAFIDSVGDTKDASALISRARERRAVQETQKSTLRIAELRGNRALQ